MKWRHGVTSIIEVSGSSSSSKLVVRLTVLHDTKLRHGLNLDADMLKDNVAL